jgi:hypothetical protein
MNDEFSEIDDDKPKPPKPIKIKEPKREYPESNSNNLLIGNQKFLRGEILASTVQIERKN